MTPLRRRGCKTWGGYGAAVLGLVLALTPPGSDTARAQSRTMPQPSSQARGSYQDGLDRYRAKDYRAAIPLFRRALELEPTSDDEEERYAPIAYLTDADNEPSKLLESEETGRVGALGLKTALASLDERSRRIIEARWLREKDPATLHELAAEFKVSAERIRQVEAKAMQKMKGLLAAA